MLRKITEKLKKIQGKAPRTFYDKYESDYIKLIN